jgi:hypothetical protein
MILFKKAIPALPVINIKEAVLFYESKMGFKARHEEKDFAILVRDNVEIHLWAACDKSWRYTFLWGIFKPIRTGAETFLAGTSSCRIEVLALEKVYQEYKLSGVLFDKKTVIIDEYWGDRAFDTCDMYGNLITFYETSN